MRWRARFAKIAIGLGVVGLVLGFLSGVGALAYFAESFPSWTGFARVPEYDGQGVTTRYAPAKTLWDWLSLLLVPVVLAVGGLLFTWFENRQTRAIEAQRITESRSVEERRIQEARDLESQRITENRKIEEERLQMTRMLERDRAEDVIVKEYLDQMTDLLLNRALRNSAEDGEVRSVARARTLAAVRGVGGVRKASIVQFLYESKLIGHEKDDFELSATVVSLSGSDLIRMNLVGVYIAGADFSGANLAECEFVRSTLWRIRFRQASLRGGNLRLCDLSGSDFYKARLEGASLVGSNLSGGDFEDANLEGCRLNRIHAHGFVRMISHPNGFLGLSRKSVEHIMSEVNFKNAMLNGADFGGADLSDFIGLTSEQLRQAKSLHGTVLPDYINPAALGDLWSPPKPKNTPEPKP